MTFADFATPRPPVTEDIPPWHACPQCWKTHEEIIDGYKPDVEAMLTHHSRNEEITLSHAMHRYHEACHNAGHRHVTLGIGRPA